MNLEIISAVDARRLSDGHEERDQQNTREIMINVSDQIRAAAANGKRYVDIPMEVPYRIIQLMIREFAAAGFAMDSSPFWHRQDGMNAHAKGIAPKGYRLNVTW